MKRVLSLVLALTLVLGTIPAGFAADTKSAGEILKGYGVLSGDANGNLNETQTIDRATMYTVLIKLLGKDAEAKAYTVPSTFTDDDTNWAANYIAFAEKEGLTKGIGNGLFSPNGKVTLQQMATIMLRALGYEADYNTAIADATAQGLLKGVVETQNAGIVVKSDVYSSMLNTLNAPVKGSTELLGNKLKIVGFNAGSELKVASISANTAKSFLVKFNRAVADADKVTFVIKKVNSEMKLTTTWNADKTEATLASTTALPEATYSVSVLADAKEVSAKDIAITAQKLTKIEITSDKLSVLTSGTIAYATYKAFDQYGNDVTTSYLTNNITWTTGVGSFDSSAPKGVLKLNSGTQNLLIYSTVVITGLDTTAGISATKSLATTTALGTLSDFKFGDASKLKLVDGDTTSVFYIPYTALDMSGNETKNYELVKEGVYSITISSSVIEGKVVKDPTNSKNAAIEIKVNGDQKNIIDLPVTITAMTLSGKVSTINTTLAKAKQLETFTLLAPTENIAAGEKVEIPFEAYDQAGNKLTKTGDIVDKVKPKVNISQLTTTATQGSLYWDERVDGTAKLMFWAPNLGTNDQTVTTYVTATVTGTTTGKMSTLNLTTQKPALPDEIQLDTSVLVTAMEDGATQKIDFGYDEGGITIIDQYDKDLDFYHKDTFKYQNPATKAYSSVTDYKVRVDSLSTDVKLSQTTYDVAGNDIDGAKAAFAVIEPNKAQSVKIWADKAEGGSATLSFTLFRDIDGDNVIDSGEQVDNQTVSMSVVKTDDIKGYTVNPVTAPIYAGITGTTPTPKDKEYAKKLKVYGTNASGAKVLLKGKPVMNVAVDNEDEFYAYTKGGSTTANAYDKSYVIALKPVDKTKTSATTNATITIFHKEEVKTVTTAITSSTVLPKAVDVGFSVSDYAGATFDEDTNTVTIENSLFTGVLQEYKADGTGGFGNGDAYFFITDNYGGEGMNFANFKVTKHVDSTGAAVTTLSIDNKGDLTGTVADGDVVTISASTNNGLVKTIKFVIVADNSNH